jgi:hypothetical protein
MGALAPEQLFHPIIYTRNHDGKTSLPSLTVINPRECPVVEGFLGGGGFSTGDDDH